MANEGKKQEAKTAKPAKDFEATYTVEELVAAATNLGTTKVVVRAALTQAGKDTYTMSEAMELINRMKTKKTSNKEVRA